MQHFTREGKMNRLTCDLLGFSERKWNCILVSHRGHSVSRCEPQRRLFLVLLTGEEKEWPDSSVLVIEKLFESASYLMFDPQKDRSILCLLNRRVGVFKHVRAKHIWLVSRTAGNRLIAKCTHQMISPMTNNEAHSFLPERSQPVREYDEPSLTEASIRIRFN